MSSSEANNSVESLDALTQAIQLQTTLQLQQNLMLMEQINLNRNLVNGFVGLYRVIKNVMAGFERFSTTLVNATLKVQGYKPIDWNTLKGLSSQTDALKDSVNAVTMAYSSISEIGNMPKEDKEAKEKEKTQTQSLLSKLGGDSFGAGDWKKGIGGMLKMIPKSMMGLNKPIKMMGAQFAAMGPQMMLLAIVIKPVMALLEGLLAPMKPITDAMGMLGQMLGMIIMPITLEIATSIIYLTSDLAEMLPALQEFALGLFNLLDPLFATINRMHETGEDLGTALANVMADAVVKVIEGFILVSDQLMSAIVELIVQLFRALPDFADQIVPAFVDAFMSLNNEFIKETIDHMNETGNNFWQNIMDWMDDHSKGGKFWDL
ncbi:MAG: hypothetical protein ACTSYF_07065 [Promethearchaeota archaeon]